MKIYFAGSIRGGRNDAHIYMEIIEYLKGFGQVLTEHVGDKNLSDKGEGNHTKFIFERDCEWLKESDVIVAEVTQPSLGVGYEIGLAEQLGKKIICLYRPTPEKSLSAMLDGNTYLKVIKYTTVEEAKLELDKIFAK